MVAVDVLLLNPKERDPELPRGEHLRDGGVAVFPDGAAEHGLLALHPGLRDHYELGLLVYPYAEAAFLRVIKDGAAVAVGLLPDLGEVLLDVGGVLAAVELGALGK